jgi:hypothetical protein
MTTKAPDLKDNHKPTQEAVHSQKLTAPLVNTNGITKKPHQPNHTVGK